MRVEGVYENFFGFQEKPFSLLPDPRFLFASRTHRMALTLLQYGLVEQTGFVILTGEVGTGKTTLLQQLLGLARTDVIVGLVNNTHRAFGELMKWILLAFDLDFRGKDPVEQHQLFLQFLIDRYAEGRRVVLVLDEAQNLGMESLEQLRMLSNVNAGSDHLLQLILVGQPELRNLLRGTESRQFVQRVAIDHHLEPLGETDTEKYIRHRLQAAGGNPQIFDDDACVAIHWFSHGIPRLINALADLALVHAFADGLRQVGIATVIEAAAARSRGGLAPFAPIPADATPEDLARRILGSRDGMADPASALIR